MNSCLLNKPSPQHGFTLLEMSIVLLVIALLAAGIVSGQSLMRSSEIRSALGEYDSYVKSIKEFQDKYRALPGDMTGATTIWGTDPGGCPNTTYSASPQTTTCNGDGNGRIGASTTAGVLSAQTEWWRAWQHLANSGFIAGKFTGIQGSGGASEAKLGINIPASKLDGGGWTLNYYLQTSDGDLWADNYGHLLNFGSTKSADYTREIILSTSEAQDIDNKMDDGKPGTGTIRAWRPSVLSDCTDETVSTQAGAIYKTSYTSSAGCALVFLLGF